MIHLHRATPQRPSLHLVTCRVGAFKTYRVGAANGFVQFCRTGSGFYRDDQGPFQIDAALLGQILQNAQLRRRPIRLNFMHWPILGGPTGRVEELRKAGEADPLRLQILPWVDDLGQPGLGIFGPVTWVPEARAHILSGKLTQFSPEIDWDHVLEWDTPSARAGTKLGPTLVGGALCDQGFFWMRDVVAYTSPRRRGAALYRERRMLTPEQYQTAVNALAAAGFAPAQIEELLGPAPGAEGAADATMAASEGAAPAGAPAAPAAAVAPAPALAAAPAAAPGAPAPAAAPAAAPVLPPPALPALAARAPQRPAATPPAAPAMALPALPAGVSPAIFAPLVAGYNQLAGQVSQLSQRLTQKDQADQAAMLALNEAMGRHAAFTTAGLPKDFAQKLAAQNPQLYAESVGNPLAGQLPAVFTPGAGGAPTLAGIAAQTADDAKAIATKVDAYVAEQKKAGRKIDTFTARKEMRRAGLIK